MTDQTASLFSREDTLLGVCEGLGEELGVAPIVFRVAFALGMFWNPLAMIVAYLALGLALAAFRFALPPRRVVIPAARPAARGGDNDDHAAPVSLAA